MARKWKQNFHSNLLLFPIAVYLLLSAWGFLFSFAIKNTGWKSKLISERFYRSLFCPENMSSIINTKNSQKEPFPLLRWITALVFDGFEISFCCWTLERSLSSIKKLNVYTDTFSMYQTFFELSIKKACFWKLIWSVDIGEKNERLML